MGGCVGPPPGTLSADHLARPLPGEVRIHDQRAEIARDAREGHAAREPGEPVDEDIIEDGVALSTKAKTRNLTIDSDVVRGIGQLGKVGDETQDVYDDYTVLEHHKSSARDDDSGRPARKTARKTATRSPAAKKAPAARKAPAKTARKTASKAAAPEAAAAPAAAPVPEPTPAPASKRAPRKTAARKSVASRVEAALAQAAADTVAAPAPAAPVAAAPAPSRGHARSDTSVQSVLACLPELAAGQGLALNVAVQRLREAQLLGKNSSSLKLFAQMGNHFDLLPAGKPTQVRLRR
jgi:hypothetical protein